MIHDNYADARAAFLEAAKDRSASLSEHVLAGAKGALGETLTMDVAVVGDARAPKALLIVSGEHGLEGAPGSAAQREALLRLPAPPADVKIVLAHALNPWGFSHRSRANEENIDVNRNFVDFSQPYQHSAAYDMVFPILCPEVWTDDVAERTSEQSQRIQQEHGAGFLLTGVTGGQRQQPTGTNYGGLAASWTRRTLEAVVAEHLSGCEKVGYIDWHSGFGDYGELFFLCTHPAGSGGLEEAAKWWGRDAVTNNGAAFQGADGALPNWQGMFAMALPQLLPNAEVAGSVIEFGTFSNIEVRTAIMIDRFLRFGRENRSSASHEELRARMLNGFVPRDPAWEAKIVERSLVAHRKALDGVAAW
ncbi:DUF2817 domain-containing protein [Sphingopyxis panaciterrulae]|uniref:DUF2817 domain-containing protein n=1 Tax=Sphingopyxis panaciterrulae TaxID=462372 RepID=A0A7W9B3A2_9SPHN|nr:DUF2817 domain-containing protein [Sphingopyxis panaciterrulae]MBB5705474.1 hypothetical protein [Sphingopyxis panaciterrulae]